MPASDLKSKVINELNGINWSSLQTSQYRDKTFEAIAKGIHSYINSAWTLTVMVNGTLINPTPMPPTPVVMVPAQAKLTVPSHSMLKTLLLGSTGVDPISSMTSMFTQIMTWLTVPPWQVSITSFPMYTTVSGTGVVTVYPTFAAMGPACGATLMGAKPNNKEDAWNIVATNIFSGLSTSVIPPIPLVGVPVPPAVSGVCIATAILTYK